MRLIIKPFDSWPEFPGSPARCGGASAISGTNLSVRMCGIVVACLKVRRELRDGEYARRNEIVFEDPILGFLPLDDSFTVEMKT